MIRSETMTNRTMYLFRLYAINREHLLVCHAHWLTNNIPGLVFHGIIGDGLLLTAQGNALKQLHGRVGKNRRQDNTPYYRVNSCQGQNVRRAAPSCEALTRYIEAHPSAWRSDELEKEDNLFPRFKESSLGTWLQHPRFLFERHWHVVAEEPGLGRGDGDTFQEETAQKIFDNQGGYVAGRGGTGKSHLIKLLRQKLEAAGWTVDVIAQTHVQSRNVDGETVLRHLHQKIGCKRHFIIVDESSQVPLRIWAVLATLKFTGSRFAVLGDIAGQLPPIADQHREALWSTLERSSYMHDLCGGLRIELEKYRRGKDYEHFKFVGDLYPGKPLGASLEVALAAARERYPVHRSKLQVQTTLTLTNACRIAVNARMNAHHAPEDAVACSCSGKDPSAQNAKVWPGLVLQSAVTDRKHLSNALRFRVLAASADRVQLVNVNDEGEQKADPFELPTDEVADKMRLTDAITIDSSQARTLYDTVRLTQTSHTHMSLRRLIVAVGRVPVGSHIEVE